MINCTFENGNQASLRHVVVTVLVLKDGQLLLTKRSQKLLEGGKWGLTGGYMDRDENLEQAGTREVMEESGWVIRNMSLLAIRGNPDRPKEDRQNVSFVFFAEAVEQTGEPDWEVDEARWFPLDRLPPAGQMAFDHLDDINLYKKYRAENLRLPVVV